MTTQKRPSPQRRHTRTTEEKRASELEQGLRLVIDGEEYVARLADVTPSIARELRANSGMGFMVLMSTIVEDPDIDLISAFVWVARRIRGELIRFEDVNIDYAQMLADGFEVSMPEGDGATEGELPEA